MHKNAAAACNDNFTQLLNRYAGGNVSGDNQKAFVELPAYQNLNNNCLARVELKKFTRNDGVNFVVWIIPYGDEGAVSGQTMWAFSREGSHVTPSH